LGLVSQQTLYRIKSNGRKGTQRGVRAKLLHKGHSGKKIEEPGYSIQGDRWNRHIGALGRGTAGTLSQAQPKEKEFPKGKSLTVKISARQKKGEKETGRHEQRKNEKFW